MEIRKLYHLTYCITKTKKNNNKKKFKVIYDRKINKSYIHFTIIRGKDIIILKKRNKKEVSESTALKQKRP